MMKFGKHMLNNPYKYGFKYDVEKILDKKGLNIKLIYNLSKIYKELTDITEFRIKAFVRLKQLRVPDWCFFEIPDISYDNINYISISKKVNKDMENTLNIFKEDITHITEFILDSTSVYGNVFNTVLAKSGIIFSSLFTSLKHYFSLVTKYLGTIVSLEDNFFTAINSCIFSEGSFVYIPNDVSCSFDLSTYFRINSEQFAQFERTLVVVGKNAKVSYVEGCSAPVYLESQLHVAVVEIIVKENGYIKYSTLQNWYRGNNLGEGGLYNFTTKRGLCLEHAYLEWVQIEVGSAITWKYPSTVLLGNYSTSDFFSIAYVSSLQITDTGFKVIHIGNYTKSRIISKGIALNSSINVYRGLVEIKPNSFYAYNYTECDSIMIGENTQVVTVPYTVVSNYTSFVHQEAKISKINEEYLFFLLQRGLSYVNAYSLILTGFCSKVCTELPIDLGSEIPLLIALRTKEFLF